MIHKVLRLFVNTLTVDDKHYVLNRENLTQLIQMQLSKKEQTFSVTIFAFLKFILNFEHLPKKMTIIAYVISGRPVPRNMVR